MNFFCENRVKIMMRKVESSIEILKSSKNESLMFYGSRIK